MTGLRRHPATRGAFILAVLLGSCGYQAGGLYAVRDVRVPVFENMSDRRTQEFDLTDAVVHELASRGIRVNAADAGYTLLGRILDIRSPSVVEGRTDEILVRSLTLRVEVELRSAAGKSVWKDERTESVSFTTSRGQSFESARQEAFDRMARWIVTHFEKEW